MIGSRMFLRLFFRCCTQLERGVEGKINCGGLPPRGGFSRSRLYFIPRIAWFIGAFLEKVCGGRKLLRERPFSFGRRG